MQMNLLPNVLYQYKHDMKPNMLDDCLGSAD